MVRDIFIQRINENSVLIRFNPVIINEPYILGINIYRRKESDNNYIKINQNPVTVDFFVDYNNFFELNESYYYKLTYIDRNGNESSLDEAEEYAVYYIKEQFEDIIQDISTNVVFRTQWAMDSFGEKGYVFIRKINGNRCPRCWDENAKLPTDSKCSVCFGTGIEGGYEKHEIRFTIGEFGRKMRETEYGFDQVTAIRGYSGVEVMLHPFDILVRQDGRRYVITNVNPILLRNMLIQQVFDVNFLQQENVGWNLKI